MQPHHLVLANQQDRLLRDEWLRAEGYPPLPHHAAAAFLLPHQLDAGRLARAVDELVARHDALRSSFDRALGDGQVRIESGLAPGAVTCHHVPGPATSDAVSETCGTIATAPFRINDEALIRAAIVTTGERGSIIVVAAEHLVCDAVSFDILLADLFNAYNGTLPPPRMSTYAAVVDARARRQLTDVSRPAGRYPVLPAYPGAKAQTSGRRSFAANSISRRVDGVTRQEIIQAARSARVPVATLCLAALAGVIHERTDGSDFRALMAVLNRATDNVDLVGWFSNSVELTIRPFARTLDLPARIKSVQAAVAAAVTGQAESVYERIRRFQPAEFGRIPVTPIFWVNCQVPSAEADPLPAGTREVSLSGGIWCVGVELNFHWLDQQLCISAAYNPLAIDTEQFSGLVLELAGELERITAALLNGPVRRTSSGVGSSH